MPNAAFAGRSDSGRTEDRHGWGSEGIERESQVTSSPRYFLRFLFSVYLMTKRCFKIIEIYTTSSMSNSNCLMSEVILDSPNCSS